MEAEKQGGQIGWQENVENVSQRMIVVCNKSVGCGDGMLPARVVTCERRVGMMKKIAMEDIAEDLNKDQQVPRGETRDTSSLHAERGP